MGSQNFRDLRIATRRLKPQLHPSVDFTLVLGPCAIESRSQLELCAAASRSVGATYLRGGAIKLRTRYSSFHGLGVSGWQMLGEIAQRYGMKSISEVTQAKDAETAAQYLDAIQIGARSMWNFELLEVCAGTGRTIVLKRGLGASTLDWLAAAERMQSYGCSDLILCERGDRSPDNVSRNAVDISVLAFLAEECPVPIWLDVSHSSGDPGVALALLRIAPAFRIAGAMAEIHPAPEESLCDADQAIPLAALSTAMRDK